MPTGGWLIHSVDRDRVAVKKRSAAPQFSDKLLDLLQILEYRLLFGSNALWWLTLFMEMTLVGWLVLDMTNSSWSVALVGFCRSAPFVVTGMFGGLLTDRMGRRQVIQIAQSCNLAVYALLLLLVVGDRLMLWHLAAGSLCLGFAWSLEFPARRALLPDIVGKERTVDGLLLEAIGQGVSRMIGPFLAGFLIARFDAVGAFAALAVVTLFSVSMVRRLARQPVPRSINQASASPWTMIGQGLRYVKQNQTILGVVLITVVMTLLIYPYITLLPVFARDILGRGPMGLGALGTGTGVGAFLGLWLITRLRQRAGNGWIFIGGTFLQCCAVMLFALSSNYATSWTLLLFAGIGQACFALMQSSIILLAASDDMRSRAMGAVVLAIGTDPLGKLQIGYAAETFGAPFALRTSAALAALLVFLIGWLVPDLRRPGDENPDARRRPAVTAG